MNDKSTTKADRAKELGVGGALICWLVDALLAYEIYIVVRGIQESPVVAGSIILAIPIMLGLELGVIGLFAWWVWGTFKLVQGKTCGQTFNECMIFKVDTWAMPAMAITGAAFLIGLGYFRQRLWSEFVLLTITLLMPVGYFSLTRKCRARERVSQSVCESREAEMPVWRIVLAVIVIVVALYFAGVCITENVPRLMLHNPAWVFEH